MKRDAQINKVLRKGIGEGKKSAWYLVPGIWYRARNKIRSYDQGPGTRNFSFSS